MAKVKLQSFQILALLTESKKLMDFLQRTGVAELQNAENEALIKHSTSETVTELQRKSELSPEFRLIIYIFLVQDRRYLLIVRG